MAFTKSNNCITTRITQFLSKTRETFRLTILFQKQPRRCSLRKSVLRNFAKFTGKHLCQSLFIKKETLARVFVIILRNSVEQLFYRTPLGYCLCCFCLLVTCNGGLSNTVFEPTLLPKITLQLIIF